MKRKIISLAIEGHLLVLDQLTAIPEVDGRRVDHIEMKRDGVYGLTRGVPNESHFAVILTNPHVDKDRVTLVIPYADMKRVGYITEKEDKDNSSEVAENLQEVN